MVIEFLDDNKEADNMSGLSRSIRKPWDAGSIVSIGKTNYGFTEDEEENWVSIRTGKIGQGVDTD